MSDCPGITLESGFYESGAGHCPGCAGDSLLREQLAQLRPYAQHTHDCLQIRGHALTHSAITVPLPCVCGLYDVYLAGLPEKEKP